MDKDLLLLLLGAGIGLLSSLLTLVASSILSSRRQRATWQHDEMLRRQERQSKVIEEARDEHERQQRATLSTISRQASLSGKIPPTTFACVVPDTRITLKDGTSKLAGQIREGDEVLSYDPRARGFVNAQVISADSEETDYLISINRQLTVSGSHGLLTTEGMREAASLKLGDFIVCEDNSAKQVTSLEMETRSEYVVALDISFGELYFANGYASCDRKTKVSSRNRIQAKMESGNSVRITGEGQIIQTDCQNAQSSKSVQ